MGAAHVEQGRASYSASVPAACSSNLRCVCKVSEWAAGEMDARGLMRYLVLDFFKLVAVGRNEVKGS